MEPPKRMGRPETSSLVGPRLPAWRRHELEEARRQLKQQASRTPEQRAYERAYYMSHPERRTRQRYPISPEMRRARLMERYGALRPMPAVCECCGLPSPTPGKPLALDHNHKTGEFRGWLCNPCNCAIGALGDDVQGLNRAIDYLLGGIHPDARRPKVTR